MNTNSLQPPRNPQVKAFFAKERAFMEAAARQAGTSLAETRELFDRHCKTKGVTAFDRFRWLRGGSTNGLAWIQGRPMPEE